MPLVGTKVGIDLEWTDRDTSETGDHVQIITKHFSYELILLKFPYDHYYTTICTKILTMIYEDSRKQSRIGFHFKISTFWQLSSVCYMTIRTFTPYFSSLVLLNIKINVPSQQSRHIMRKFRETVFNYNIYKLCDLIMFYYTTSTTHVAVTLKHI